MLEEMIETSSQVMWAVDSGEAGYVLLIISPHYGIDEYNKQAWDFVVTTAHGYILGASDHDEQHDLPKIKAGGPLWALITQGPLEVLASLCSFLRHAADCYVAYDMQGKLRDSSGDELPFNEPIREWAYANIDSLEAAQMELPE